MEIDRTGMHNQYTMIENCEVPFFNDISLATKEKNFITGIMTIRNAYSLGYPFLEAILSVIPVLDEIVIGDGGSTDETLSYLIQLQKIFPKIKIISTPWYLSKQWKSFDDAIDKLIQQAHTQWIWEIQSDEFCHEKNLLKLFETVKMIDSKECNALRQPIILYGWSHRDSYKYRSCRIVRKILGLSSHWGGDDFQIDPERSPRYGFTSHNIPPELDIDIEIIHMSRAFLLQRVLQDEANVRFCNIGKEDRERTYQHSKKTDWSQYPPPDFKDVLPEIPALMKGLSQEKKYVIRQGLFDKEWLLATTGLNYE